MGGFLLVLLALVGLAACDDVTVPRFCVNKDALRIFGKRVSCVDALNTTIDELVHSPEKARAAMGTLKYSRMHEVFAYYWFVESESNPYRVEDCSQADVEYIPFLPLDSVAALAKPDDVCSYKQLIADIVTFVDADTNSNAKRFVVASTFNLRTEMALGLPHQQRNGPVYDKVTTFVTNTYIGHYERFHQCPDVLRKGWKGVIEIPYIPLSPVTKRRRKHPQQQSAPSDSSVLFAGRLYLFGPERVCSVRTTIASLATPVSAEAGRNFEMTVVNMTLSVPGSGADKGGSGQQATQLRQAEDRVGELYSHHSFCLVSKGDSYSSASLYTAIQSLCVPIVVADWAVFAFNWVVPYHKFVMRISEEDFLRDPEKAIAGVVKYCNEESDGKTRVQAMRREMRVWRKVLRYSVEAWEEPTATRTREYLAAFSPAYRPLPLNSDATHAETVLPLELFLLELRYKHLEMTERPGAPAVVAIANPAPFVGNDSLSCGTPFHCPPFAHVVPPFEFPGNGKSGLPDTRSALCRRAHGLIGMYKMVYFMGCVRILWPLRPGHFKPNDERALSEEEKAFVTQFHKIGYSPEEYPPLHNKTMEAIVHVESLM